MTESSSIRIKSDWNSLPEEIIDRIASRVDMLSTVRLAACSSGLYRLLVVHRLDLFKPPCLLMPDLEKWLDAQHQVERVVSIMPLDFYPSPVTLNFMEASLLSLPFVIPPPLLDERQGKWFLARSAHGERLMIVRMYDPVKFYPKATKYKGSKLCEYPDSGCQVFEQDPSLFGPSGFLHWRPINSLDTQSLFLGLSYPINQEITHDKDPDGSAIPYNMENYVYTAYHGFCKTPIDPEIRRYSLKPKEDEGVQGIRLPVNGWIMP